ncbi:uncharacterized protein [Branchiostoma lanceolatum]|uniref:uncharacterized protein n=1 Tax=Branchiostoma lanceolatum TaxID=7740 RepID=UPI003451A692
MLVVLETFSWQRSAMLRVCEKLREADERVRSYGPVPGETVYLRALVDAMADMDRSVEVEVLKSLGDVNLEKKQFHKAMMLYRTASLLCENADVAKSLDDHYWYAEKLREGKRGTIPCDYEPQTNDEKMSSPAKVAEKFLHPDQRLISGCDNDPVLIEYAKLMIEGIADEDNMLRVEAIKSIGDVYLKRGKETRDTPGLTKATALYSTALAQCEGVQGIAGLTDRLFYTARIRKEMAKEKTTRKKGIKCKRQQEKCHLRRNLAVTSSDTDVIGEAKGQQFMSPSDYISSQTPEHVPDCRAYDEYLTTGDRALADGNLELADKKFAASLKLIHDPNKPDLCKEAECLCKLGDVYVQQGKTTKEGKKFTQAAALYNAAMVRTDKNKHIVTKRLLEIEQWFLWYAAKVNIKSVPSNRAMRHQKRLKEMRARAKLQLEDVDRQHNPYQYDEKDPKMKNVEAERAEAVKALFKTIAKDRQCFIKDLVGECIETLGPPPCKYAFIGLGSQATELVTPYSDLEFAILIENGKDNDDTRWYFLNITHYLHLKVINLGETILPAMAIPSLNDFQSEDPEKDWFFDFVTPRGFAFDGFMPWASKTPFGRDKTKSKASVSLIQTPAEMAKFQHMVISLSEGYHLSDILRRYVFLAGDETLVSEYLVKLSEVITDVMQSHLQCYWSAIGILCNYRNRMSYHEPTGQLINVKKDIYRFPGIAIELLALCCQISVSSTWDVIDRLNEFNKIKHENATHLMVLVSISAELRLRTYMANGGQNDSLSPLAEMKYQSETHEVHDSILKSIFYIPDTKALFRYYCRAIPLEESILNIVSDVPFLHFEQILKTTIFNDSNEFLARISSKLFLSNKSLFHLEAALKDAGSDTVKRSNIYFELGTHCLIHCDLSKAKQYFEQSLQIRLDIYGENKAHPEIAQSLQYLGSLWQNLGDPKKAISYFKQSLTMRKTIYGDNKPHPDIAESLQDLGKSWSKVGDKKKTMSYYEQSLAMIKAIYGDNTAHPDIAASLYILGSSCGEFDDHKKAISYLEQSLTMMKTIFKGNTAHPGIAQSLQGLGLHWSDLGNQEKAIGYSKQALAILKIIYGDNAVHPGIATALNNLGRSWRRLGDHKKAISYLEQSLAMRKTIYGEKTAHQNIALVLLNLGMCWLNVGDYPKAISYCEQTIEMMETIYGDDKVHPHIAQTLLHLGSSWGKLGELKKSISYFEQSLTMRKTIYGDNMAHLDIAHSLHNLGLSWSYLDQKKAISYLEQSLTMRKTIHGGHTAHPDIAESLFYLGSSGSEIGDQRKANKFYEESLEMRKTLY